MDISKYLITPENLESYLSQFSKTPQTLAHPEFWKGKTVLITGISGFVGSHLTDTLVGYGSTIHGLVRRHAIPDYQNIKHQEKNITLHEGNITDMQSMTSLIARVRPDIVFHLGAQSFVPTSFRAPFETYETNIIGTANLLEACRRVDSIQAIHLAGSSEEYGNLPFDQIPINEQTPLHPMSPYGVSKVATDTLGVAYYDMYRLPTVITRAFNHMGPRRGLQFVTSVVARQLARCIIKGTRDVTIGKPDAIRDFSHISDIIQGYLLAVEKARRGTPYNIGHGLGVSIENTVRIGAKINNIPDIRINIDKERFRPAEVDILICDYSKANKEWGYRPLTPFTTSLQQSIDFFRENPSLIDVERH